jgi:uncharacterized heparinase superfamily protein
VTNLIKRLLRAVTSEFKNKTKKIKVNSPLTPIFQRLGSGYYISNNAFLSAAVGSYTSIHDFLKDFRGRETPISFLKQLLNSLELERDTIVRHADKICNHIFDLLGSIEKFLGEKIDWHADFKTGVRWNPKEYYKNVKIVRGDGSDIKVPWELSRFQHLTILGKAYWLTPPSSPPSKGGDRESLQGGEWGSEKYAREFVAQISDWIDSNPVYFGVNWACTMDVAIRAANWITGYYYFKDSLSLADDFLLKFLKSILAHGRFIRNNLEWSEELTSNHYLSNITGLVYLGIMFPEFKEASEWKEFGIKEMVSEIDKQVYEDGVDFESSLSYHRLVLELFFYPALLCKINNIELPEKFWSKLKKMFEFVRYYLKPNGLAPQIGDNDNGRLHIFEEREVNDHSYLLTLGSLLFPSSELRTPNPASKAFKDAGIYIMRDDNVYMIISCGPNGQKGNGGHCHNDKLNFELNVGGEDMIIDPGTFVYTPDPEWRNKFRSTAYHNTIMIDGEEQNRFRIPPRPPFFKGGVEEGLFTMEDDAKARCIKWETTPNYDIFIGEHYGYTRLKEPVIHQREIYFDKKKISWQIKDRLISRAPEHQSTRAPEGEHLIECFFHFSPSVNLKQILNSEFQILGTRDRVTLKLNSSIFNLQSSIQSDWVSPSYGVKIPAPVAVCRMKTKLPLELNFEICLKTHQ